MCNLPSLLVKYFFEKQESLRKHNPIGTMVFLFTPRQLFHKVHLHNWLSNRVYFPWDIYSRSILPAAEVIVYTSYFERKHIG